MKNGSPNASGHYDGLIGMAQRGDVDCVMRSLRGDSLLHEPVVLSPPLLQLSFIIASGASTGTSRMLPVTDVYKNLDPLTYSMAAICLVLLAAFVAFDKKDSAFEFMK